MTGRDGTARNRPRIRWLSSPSARWLAIAAVAVTAVVVGALLGGAIGRPASTEVAATMATSPSASPTPTSAATATPTATPSPTASPSSTPSPTPIPPSSAPQASPSPAATPAPIGAWTTSAPMPAGSRIADAAVTIDGRIHAWVVGAGDEPVRAYDPLSDSWSLEAPVALPGPIPFEGELVDDWGYGDESEVAAGGDGLIYMTWGAAGPEFRLFAYDPSTRRWEREAAVVFDEFVFDMATGTDGDIYLLTGSKVLRFDVDERRIEDAPEATAGFNSLASAGDRVFAAFGGIGGTGDAAFYDAARRTWSATEKQPGIDVGGWAADLDGWLYGVQIEPSSLAVVRDPAVGQWMPLPTPPGPLGSDVIVADGKLYVIGSGVPNAVFERQP